MSVGIPLAGPDAPAEQPHLKLFDPGVDALQRTLVQKACDILGPSAADDAYFTDKGLECLSAVIDAPKGMHGESVWSAANVFFSRLLDTIGLLERMSPDAAVLKEMHDIRRRCIKAFPGAFNEPDRL